jgi:hypothetical protein
LSARARANETAFTYDDMVRAYHGGIAFQTARARVERVFFVHHINQWRVQKIIFWWGYYGQG